METTWEILRKIALFCIHWKICIFLLNNRPYLLAYRKFYFTCNDFSLRNNKYKSKCKSLQTTTRSKKDI